MKSKAPKARIPVQSKPNVAHKTKTDYDRKRDKKVTQEITYIDPPSGWKYGFPKALPDDCLDVRKFLVDSGYPEGDVDFAMSYLRMWTEND